MLDSVWKVLNKSNVLNIFPTLLNERQYYSKTKLRFCL